MRNDFLFGKGVAVAIIGLFLCSSLIPSISGITSECSTGDSLTSTMMFEVDDEATVTLYTFNILCMMRHEVSIPADIVISIFESFEELMSAFKRQVEYYNRIAITGLTCTENAFLALAPTPYASGLIADCIELGKDIESGGCHYKTAATRPVGMANVGNSLAAIKKLVFEEHKLTAAQLMHAMETNFEDDSAKPTGEEIRQMLLAVPKFGNDDDCVDSLTREATDYAAKDMHSYVTDIGSQGSVQLAPVSQNVPFGELTGATPDGRKAGTPTADGISPTQGTDKKGPTAVIKSAGKLNHITCDNGTLLNQKITPTVMKDISG